MLKRLNESLYAATAFCQTLQACPAGARYLIVVIGIVAIAYLVHLAYARV